MANCYQIIKFQTGPALIHDAVRMFSASLREYSLFNDADVEELDCQNPTVWSHGRPILDLLDKVIPGLLFITIRIDWSNGSI